MHGLGKAAVVSINAIDTLERSFSLLGIGAMMAVNALEVEARCTFLADSLTSNDSQPFQIILGKSHGVVVRTSLVLRLMVAATTSNVMLIAELDLLQSVDFLVVVLHFLVDALIGLVQVDDWSNGLRGCDRFGEVLERQVFGRSCH